MAFSATGGTKSTDGDFTVHVFTGDGTLECTGTGLAEVLIVAGGGGGGRAEADGGGDSAGGGGGGGVVTSLRTLTGNMAVVVGDGGAGSTNLAAKGGTGEDSTFGGLTAAGGGGGGSDQTPAGANGGCGGGACNSYGASTAGGTGSQGGNGAGTPTPSTSYRGGSGGGGAGEHGVQRAYNSGAGGAGRASRLRDGSAVYYGGGGGGGAFAGTAGAGGTGGGAAGGNGGHVAGYDASANTGGGGGGGYKHASGYGGAGGSGIVVVRYLTDQSADFEAGGGTETEDGEYTVHVFTSDGTLECQGCIEAEVLVIGGGGAGGSHGGGGGGGGQKVARQALLAGDMAVVVGDGGTPGAVYNAGGNGEDSELGDWLIARGGGGGAAQNMQAPLYGGCGGGGGGGTNPATAPGQAYVGLGSSGVGYIGGLGTQTNRGGGGGGQAAAGQAASAGAAGGDGVASDIVLDGTNVTRGGGGGGGSIGAAAGGAGGAGGGGAGSKGYNTATAGTANTGGGGGGSGGSGAPNFQAYAGAAGGSGIVVVRYLTPEAGVMVDDDLDGSHRLLTAVDDDLDGSHRMLVWADDDLDGSHLIVGWMNDDLDGSHRMLVWAPDDDLDGSHRMLVWAPDDDLSGSYVIWGTAAPASRPKLLYVPKLSFVVDDVDLVAAGADRSSIRYGNDVVGGHGGASVEIPKRPAEKAMNGLVLGADAALYDAGRKLWEGVVKKVAGPDTGDGQSTTRITFCGRMDYADLDESLSWSWVDADYSMWQEVAVPASPVNASVGSAGAVVELAPQEAAWEVRTDGELYIATVAGSTYYGDAWYVRKPCAKRLAFVLDKRTIGEWPSGSYDRLGGIMAVEFDYRVRVGAYFRARLLQAQTPLFVLNGADALWTKNNVTESANDQSVDVADSMSCLVLELDHYAQYDHTGTNEFVQLLHVRVAVRPDGPASRAWTFGDDLPRLDECLSDLLEVAGAASVDAEVIGDPLQHAKVSGPTLTQAAQQVSEFDEDEDGTGQPLEYGIWDDAVGIARRRPAEPDRLDQWLAIDTKRDAVAVDVDYEDAADAPDFVEVRYTYLKTNLVRHHSPAAEGYWAARGEADDRPYDWSFSGAGTYEHDVVTVDGQRRYSQYVNGAYCDAIAQFPANGQYPVASASGGQTFMPFTAGLPLRFQMWARQTGDAGAVRPILWYYLNGDFRGSDTFYFDPVISDTWGLVRYDLLPDPTSAANEMMLDIRISTGSVAHEGTLFWRNAQLYYLIPEGTTLSAWYPYEPADFASNVKTYDLTQPATLWQARNSARKFWTSFRRGVGKGTIEAEGVLYDMRGREVPVNKIRGGWWASIVNDPRCTEPLYVSSIECEPEALTASLGIGGERPAWSDRRPMRERPRFGRYSEWRGFNPNVRSR